MNRKRIVAILIILLMLGLVAWEKKPSGKARTQPTVEVQLHQHQVEDSAPTRTMPPPPPPPIEATWDPTWPLPTESAYPYPSP